jgi:hypothetical protein
MTMNKIYFEIFGGAQVHFGKSGHKILKLMTLLILGVVISSTSAFAQGSIYGSVTNSDASTPANGEITFYGFLDNTDEEIRIETCVGAGYDAGNWYDDFQNYLTEAAGNPYAYRFYNVANGEGAVLSSTIPNNSFQQEDILLAEIAWPAAPIGLAGRAVSSSAVALTWNRITGLTYHVYRRSATSNGSFFRIDDPGGSLSNPGTANAYFFDNTVDGASSYQYLVIAEDASGNLSPHSAVITVNSANVQAPAITSVVPDSGALVGGAAVTINGVGFDMNGAVATIGGNLLTSIVVVSPRVITGLTPAGAAAGPVDVIVTNIASTLASAPLTGGYNYLLNVPPVLDSIGPQAGTEGVYFNFAVTASDADGTVPSLLTSTLPGTATFTDSANGSGLFEWTPGFADAGLYQVTFYAADAEDTVFEVVDITIADVGNQAPVLDSIGLQTVAEGSNLNFNITGSDPDLDSVYFSAENLPTNAAFADSGNGVGNFDFSPDFGQEGVYFVTFKIFDGALVDSEVVEIDVTGTNQIPVLAAIGAQVTDENVNLNFTVSATDADGDSIILSTSALPGTAAFTDNGDGTGSFDWTPGYTDAAVYNVTFYATDTLDTDSELITITVNDAGNQPPVLDSIGALATTEGDSLIAIITASDPDGDAVSLLTGTLPTNAGFVDSGNGVGAFTFTPDYIQEGVYNVLFYASDGILDDSETVVVTVNSSGNQPPIITAVADTTIDEGDSLVTLVTAYDPDGVGVLLSVTSTITNFNFVDSGNGVGLFRFASDFYSAGQDTVWFYAVDFESPPAVTIDTMAITITDVNQPPVIDSIGPFGVAIGDTLRFDVTATDSTDPITTHRLFFTAVGQPTNSQFVDNGDNSGTFMFYPDSTQVGPTSVTFIATDMGSPQLTDNIAVNITVVRENNPPEWDSLDYVSPLEVLEGETVELRVSASDADGGVPALYATKLPENATFVDSGNGAGLFTFTPNYIQAGLYEAVLAAYDGIDDTKAHLLIQVYEAGNQPPVFDSIPTDTVTEGNTLTMTISASDPDTTIPTLSVDTSTMPEGAEFVDNGDGTGTITFTPTYVQSGTYYVYVFADDGEYTDTITVEIDVIDAGNQYPEIVVPEAQTVAENANLTFDISSSDPDMTTPILSGNLPTGASFTDNNDYTGTFSWTPDYTQAAVYEVWFYATDSLDPGLVDSGFVEITVTNINQLPRYDFPYGDHLTVNEGDTGYFRIETFDPDGPTPNIKADTAYPLQAFMSFADSLNGWGWIAVTPGYDVVSSTEGTKDYYLRLRIYDSADTTVNFLSAQFLISVRHVNRPPVITTTINDTTITEGGSLSRQIIATDPDGSAPTLRAENLPANATFTGAQSYVKLFSFNPDFTQAGSYQVLFIASDNILEDTAIMNITVQEAGNQAPIFDDSLPLYQVAVIDQTLENHITASDPEMETLTITPSLAVNNGIFVDSGNGAASFVFTPTISQLDSIYNISYFAQDPHGAADTLAIIYRVVAALRGDANTDGILDMLDIMYLINYLYREGAPPMVEDAADANFDGTINLIDPTYMVDFLFRSGPPPPIEKK